MNQLDFLYCEVILRIYIFFFLSSFLFGCDSISNFIAYKTVKKAQVDGIDGEISELVHRKSGAKILLIKNKDKARSFNIAFKTPPYDDTGLFHIFEHAVLAGSRLYPSKSNFFNVLGSSVASYINATTWPFFTWYPFVTTNYADFENLFSVYMDAVFFPKVLTEPNIIKREGWRFEVDQKEKLSINGIVLSEMKGVFSNPMAHIEHNTEKIMVKNSPIAFQSGGLPSQVASLTFEQIRDAHQKYYRPQNALIVLYGDIDYPKVLSQMNSEFLSHFKKDEEFKDPEVTKETKLPEDKEFIFPYPGEDKPNKDFVVNARYIKDNLNSEESMFLKVILNALIDEPSSPLRELIQKEKLAKNLSFDVSLGFDHLITIIFEGSSATKKLTLKEKLNEVLNDAAENGINKDLLLSVFNSFEFSYKEQNLNGNHRGMGIAVLSIRNWILYHNDFFEQLNIAKRFEKIRAMVNDANYVKSFIKKHLIANPTERWFVFYPNPNFSKEFNQGLDKRIDAALSKKTLKQWKKESKEFKDWVSAKEDPTILAKTPSIDLKTVKVEFQSPQRLDSKVAGVETFFYPKETNGISYVDFFFDLSGLPLHQIKLMKFFVKFIQQTDTDHYKYKDLSREIAKNIGDLSFHIHSFQSIKDRNQFKPTLWVRASYLDVNIEKVFSIITELFNHANFGPYEHIKNLVGNLKSDYQFTVARRAPMLSELAATKSFFPQLTGFLAETQGGSFEKYMKLLDTSNDQQMQFIQNNLALSRSIVFNRDRLYLMALTSTQKQRPLINERLQQIVESLETKSFPNQQWFFDRLPQFDSFSIPGEVQYVTLASDVKDILPYHGSLVVYANYLRKNYLIPKLREQQGAYGANSKFGKNGIFTMSTYRDPNLKKSITALEEVIEFMEKNPAQGQELIGVVIKSLMPYFKDEAVIDQTTKDLQFYLTEQSWEDYQRIKTEIMSTTPEKMAEITEKLKLALKTKTYGVVGNKEILKKEGEFLKNTYSLE